MTVAITVTEIIKQRNQLTNAVGSILVRTDGYPKTWVNESGNTHGYKARTDLHEADGWRDVSIPPIGANQRRGPIFFDEANDVFTYEVIDFTDEEIQQNLIAQSQSQKQELIRQIQEEAVVSQAQEFDDTAALDNQALFPFWQELLDNQTEMSLGNKLQHPVGTEIWLFKVNQPSLVAQEQFPPNSPGTEALYTRVAYPGEILPWSQPSGAQDAYEMGAKVTHNGSCWENTGSPANVWEPGVFGWTEIPCE